MNGTMKRFIDIWKPDFLALFFTQGFRDRRTTILFWILSNSIIALIITISAITYIGSLKAPLLSFIQDEFNMDAAIAVVDGQLQLTDIPEPYLREVTASNEGSGASGDMVFIIDTSERVYNITTLDDYSAGVIALRDRVYIKDGVDMQQYLYADMPPFGLTRSDIITYINTYFHWMIIAVSVVIFMTLLFFFSVVRLVSALWWALMLWVFARIVEVKATFGMSYMAVLNLYFIPTIVSTIVLQFLFNPPYFTTAMFIAIFVVNLWWIRRNVVPETDVPITQTDHAETDDTVGGVVHKDQM